MNNKNISASTEEIARDYDEEVSSISGRSYNEEDDLCEPFQQFFTQGRNSIELENCKEYRASLSEDSSTSEASCDVSKDNVDCLIASGNNGGVFSNSITSEEEDLDELFRLERNRMVCIRENGRGKQRPNSLPAPLNTKYPLTGGVNSYIFIVIKMINCSVGK